MSYLPSTEIKQKTLTKKQQAFLDNLIVTKGNPKEAAELAGYSGNYYQVIKSLREEVIELASDVLARSAPEAAFKLVEIMNTDRPLPQIGNKLQAAQTILDRVGVAKKDRLDVTHRAAGGIFILPEKQPIEAEAEDVEYNET
jgi:phage terminase small subunit